MTHRLRGQDNLGGGTRPRGPLWRRNRVSRADRFAPGHPDSAPHILIVGGGFAGLNVAKALRDAVVRITLVDSRNYHLFQPLLYQVATATLSPADIATPIRSILRSQGNATVLLAEARRVDPGRKVVELTNGPMRYDALVLAAGAEPQYFDHDDWEPLAPGLKSIDDAVEVRRRIFSAFEAAEREHDDETRKQWLTFVVVGGGPTGVELAGALGEIAHYTLRREFRSIDPNEARVILIEGSNRILSAFPEKSSRSATRDLERLGVEIRTGARVTGIKPGLVHLEGEQIVASTVLWGAGVRAVPLGATLGVPTDRAGRVIVGPDLTVPGHPEIFVIGDLAAATDDSGNSLPGLAPVAIQEARCTAANVLRLFNGEKLQPFRYSDRGVMATVGRNRAVAVVKGVAFDGLPAWLAWVVVHVVMLIGFRNRVAVTLQWMWAYATRQRSARLITAGSRPAQLHQGSTALVRAESESVDVVLTVPVPDVTHTQGGGDAQLS